MFLVKFTNRTIQYAFYFLFFLVPLIMTPFNYELFEFNKMMLVYALTVIIGASWLIKMIVSKRLVWHRTPLDIPIFIFLISQVLSYLFSIDRHTSFWGYYGRFSGGLLSTISYVILYYAFVSNFRACKKTSSAYVQYLKILLASGFLVSAYGIAEHFGIDAQYWVQDVQTRVFSTLGQPNWLAAYLAVLLPLALAFALNSKHQAPNKQFGIFFVLSFIFYLCLLYTRSRSGFLGFSVAYLVFWGLGILKERKGLLRQFLLFTFSLLLLTFLIGTPFERVNRYFTLRGLVSPHLSSTIYHLPSTAAGGTESGEIRRIVWRGALNVWQHYPLFGSGPETFAYSYYQFRPKEHNLTSEWDFLYNKAHNEYLNFLATTGLVGLAAYLVFIGSFLAWFIRIITSGKQASEKKWPYGILLIGLFSGWFSILITNFFGFSVAPVALFFFLIPAISFTLFSRGVYLNPPRGWDYTDTLGFGQKLAIIMVLIAAGCFLLVVVKFWFADVGYAKGRGLNQTGQYDSALRQLQTAISLNPSEPIYKEEISTSLAHLAFLAQQQESEVLSKQLAREAVGFSDQAIEISPYNLNFWKGRAKMFYTLSQIDEKYFENALTALTTAHMLAPTDAKIGYNLGLVLGQIGQNEKAIDMLEKTVDLKRDYRNARYALALFYYQADMDEKAIGELEYILGNIATDDGGAKKKLEEWRQ